MIYEIFTVKINKLSIINPCLADYKISILSSNPLLNCYTTTNNSANQAQIEKSKNINITIIVTVRTRIEEKCALKLV